MHPFRKAVEEGDETAIQALLADDVVFTSPVAFKPYVGKPITAAILRGVLRVFEDFRYIREIHDSNGGNHALEFEAGIAGAPGVTVNGCDFLHVNDDGLIDDFKVMVRPRCPKRWPQSFRESSRRPSNWPTSSPRPRRHREPGMRIGLGINYAGGF